MTLNINLPLNSLSFGHVSYNILKELYKKNIDCNIFLIGNNGDLSSFDKINPDFAKWIQNNTNKALSSYSRNDPEFRLWHISGSETSYSNDKYLFTFHECSALTPIEVNILNNQKAIFVSSNYTKQIFELNGVKTPVFYVPLGFDSENFSILNKKYYSEDIVVWSIFGKLEHRKRHEKTIRTWLKKFGNNPKHQLHLHVYNQFLSPEQNNQLLNNIFEGKRYFNVVLQPYTKTLSEFNDCLNATNIVLDMSGGEAWSLPSFHCVGLGKHAIVHNCTAMKEWANDENAILVDSSSQIEVYDGIFFHKGQPMNQGLIFDYLEIELLSAFDKVLERYNQNKINEKGFELQNKFKWEKSVDKMLSIITN